MGASSSAPENPLYLSTCSCGEVQIELLDEPIQNFVCYCDDCQAGVYFVESKAKASGNKSTCPCLDENPNNRGFCGSLFYVGKMRFVKGVDKIKGFRNNPMTNMVRPYTSCCNTILVAVGGAEFPTNFRMLNSNTITVAATGEKFKPTFACKMQGKHSNPEFWSSVSERDGIKKVDDIPLDILMLFVSHMVFGFAYPGKGDLANDTQIVGINSRPADFEEVNPISSYHAVGLRTNQTKYF